MKRGILFVIHRIRNLKTRTMKKSILSLMMILLAGLLTSAVAQEIIPGAQIEFEKDVHDFGELPYDGDGVYSFVFKNTGDTPLIISNAKGSCGCTVPTWPKAPIAVGETAEISVKYDTKRTGSFHKSVTITSNAVNDPIKIIKITGSILSEPAVPVESVVPIESPVVDVVIDEVEEPVVVRALTKKEQRAAKKAMKKAMKKVKKAARKLAKKQATEAKKAAKTA